MFSTVTRAMETSDIPISNYDGIKDESASIYQKEWDSLFSNKFYLERLKSFAMKGSLKASHFRSISWKLFLECLPEDHHLWIDTAKSQRQQYIEILDKFDTNPRIADTLDIAVNNPLSQSHQSPWNQYFQDTELKITIEQDVVRTFPEIEFFHSSQIQKMMISILFSFAREFPYISYKQGMHELLAPIIFVLHHDQQTYLQASEIDSLDLKIHILLNQNYIEHDAFFIFCKVMEAVETWYTTNDSPFSKYATRITEEPFSESVFTGNSLGRKLKNIYEQLLKHHDSELFMFLEQMEITPQIFGIRWLRLLFGREFSIHDLLVVWDAIFADSITFSLVDYIFVAMLISIRDLLLQVDYASCLSHLMRFPNGLDVQYIINLALHLRDPNGFKKPDGSLVKILNPLHLKVKDSKHTVSKGFSKSIPSISKPVKGLLIPNKHSDVRPKSLTIAQCQNNSSDISKLSTTGARMKSSSLIVQHTNDVPSDINEFDDSGMEFLHTTVLSAGNKGASYTLPRTRIQNVMESRSNKFHVAAFSQTLEDCNEKKSSSENVYKEMVPLQPSSSTILECSAKDYKISSKVDDARLLKEEISELKTMNEYCTRQITQHLEKLQESMMHQRLLYEDEMFIALAGLKRARDILKGTVSFTEEVLGDDLNPYCTFSQNVTNHSTVVSTDLQTNVPVSKCTSVSSYNYISNNDDIDICNLDHPLGRREMEGQELLDCDTSDPSKICKISNLELGNNFSNSLQGNVTVSSSS